MGEEKTVVRDQLRVKRLLEVFCSGPKTQILKILLENECLTATDVSRRLGVKLSTTLSHLESLVSAGLVSIRVESIGGRSIKKYCIESKKMIIELDLEEIVAPKPVEESKETLKPELEALILEYINIKRQRRSKIPVRFKVRDVARTLGIDIDTAIEIVNYMNTRQDRIAELLCNEILDEIKKNNYTSIREASDKLLLHPYWIVSCIHMIGEEKGVILRDGVIKRQ